MPLYTPSGAWLAYTPAWTGSTTNPVIGNGTISGQYIQIGKTVHFRINILLGSTTTVGSGNYSFSTPTTSNESATNFPPTGNWAFFDSSSGNNYLGFAAFATTTTVQCLTISIVTSSLAAGIMSATAPVVPATSDRILIRGTYESV